MPLHNSRKAAASRGPGAGGSGSTSPTSKATKRPGDVEPSARLNLTEFLGCLVRISFLRANPTLGQRDNPYKLMELPLCLQRMLVEQLLPNAKQDTSAGFRDELAANAEVQAVLDEYRPRLQAYYAAMSAVKLSARSKGNQVRRLP